MNKLPIDRSGNRYCGPLSIAAILDLRSTSEAAAMIRSVGSKTSVKGTSTYEMVAALRSAGCEVQRLDLDKKSRTYMIPGWNTCEWNLADDEGNPLPAAKVLRREGPTVAGWLRQTHKTRDPKAFYLLWVTGHYVVVRGRKFIDTFTKGEWVFLRSAPGRRRRVVGGWKVYAPVRA